MPTIRDVKGCFNSGHERVANSEVRGWFAGRAKALLEAIAQENGCQSPARTLRELPPDTYLGPAASLLFAEVRELRWKLWRIHEGARSIDSKEGLRKALRDLPMEGELWLSASGVSTKDVLNWLRHVRLDFFLVINDRGEEIVIRKLDPADSIGGSI